MAKRKKIGLGASDRGVAYVGRVRLEYYRGKRLFKTAEVHNTGTAEFFRIMALALTKESSALSMMPRFVHCFHAANQDVWTNSTCTANVPYTSSSVKYDVTNAAYCATFTFLIPFTQLPVTQSGGVTVTTDRLALYNTTDFSAAATPLAYFDLAPSGETDNSITPDGQTSVIVTWTMAFENGSAYSSGSAMTAADIDEYYNDVEGE